MNPVELTSPKNYGELSQKQLIYLTALMLSGQSEEQIRIKCFLKFSGIKIIAKHRGLYSCKKNAGKELFTISAEQVMFFSKKFDWMFRDFKGIQPITKIGCYMACDKFFRNLKFEDYLMAENHYQAYIFTKDNKHLVNLMSVLYRKGGSQNNHSSVRYIKFLSSPVQRQITLMWMVGVKEFLSEKFTYLFVRVNQEMDENPKAPDMFKIMTDQVRMLTNGDLTKNEQVLKSNTWDALNEMNEKCKEIEQLKKETNV